MSTGPHSNKNHNNNRGSELPVVLSQFYFHFVNPLPSPPVLLLHLQEHLGAGSHGYLGEEPRCVLGNSAQDLAKIGSRHGCVDARDAGWEIKGWVIDREVGCSKHVVLVDDEAERGWGREVVRVASLVRSGVVQVGEVVKVAAHTHTRGKSERDGRETKVSFTNTHDTTRTRNPSFARENNPPRSTL